MAHVSIKAKGGSPRNTQVLDFNKDLQIRLPHVINLFVSLMTIHYSEKVSSKTYVKLDLQEIFVVFWESFLMYRVICNAVTLVF